MHGLASVLSFIHRSHLPQRQCRGRQDPVVTLRKKDGEYTRERRRVKVEKKKLAGLFASPERIDKLLHIKIVLRA